MRKQKLPLWFTVLTIVVLVTLALALLPLARTGYLTFLEDYRENTAPASVLVAPTAVYMTPVVMTRVVTVIQTAVPVQVVVTAVPLQVVATATPEPPKVEFHGPNTTMIEGFYNEAVGIAFEELLPGAMTAMAVVD